MCEPCMDTLTELELVLGVAHSLPQAVKTKQSSLETSGHKQTSNINLMPIDKKFVDLDGVLMTRQP